MSASPTLGELSVERGVVTIPRWGLTTIQAVTLGEDDLAGERLTFKCRGLEVSCTVVDGGVERQRGHWLCVAGAGKWSEIVKARGYRNAGGVKLSSVVSDVAREIGEDTGDLPSTSLGPAFDRREREASAVLDAVSPDDWYVDEDGKLQIGHRAASELDADYVLEERAPHGQLLTIRARDWSAILPGAQLEGVEVATVRHEVGENMRTLLWATSERFTDRAVGALRRIIGASVRQFDYYRIGEYRISKASDDGYLDIRPIRSTSGLPRLTNVAMRAGVPGGGGLPQIDSTVLVAFADGVPVEPRIIAYDGEAANGWKPSKARLNASTVVEVGKDAATVELAGGSQFVALSNLVKSELQTLAGLYNAHQHVETGGTTDATLSTYTPGEVKASKTKAT